AAVEQAEGQQAAVEQAEGQQAAVEQAEGQQAAVEQAEGQQAVAEQAEGQQAAAEQAEGQQAEEQKTEDQAQEQTQAQQGTQAQEQTQAQEDTQAQAEEQQEAVVQPPPASPAKPPPPPSIVSLLYLKSYQHMGQARVECVKGCTCAPTVVDAHHGTPASQTYLHTFEASPHKDCRIRVTVLEGSNSGEHKFKVIGAVLSEQPAGSGGSADPFGLQELNSLHAAAGLLTVELGTDDGGAASES
ncbi:hypothetical protein H632_c3839p0, partial [Helicosporidium sp. ATCC 50920]